MRIVRAWSAIARVIAWRIHHVAYVRELEAAAILVLVDRPHQARVAFLNQVQEAQAAVAVLLGDRHHQPQVAAGELALDVLELAGTGRGAVGMRRRRLPGLSSVRSISSRSSWRIGAILSGRARRWRAASASCCLSSSMRRDISSSCRISGCTRRVRRLNSSTSMQHLARRRMNALAGRGLRLRPSPCLLVSMREIAAAAPPSSARSVGRLCGMRA